MAVDREFTFRWSGPSPPAGRGMGMVGEEGADCATRW
jgi:hypothetical protein